MGKVKPNARQLEFQDWEMGIFLHFGIRTFHEGHKDWDGKPMSCANFNPSSLDCRQWTRSAAAAGAKYMVLTAKHHDGFANWPSAFTDFSVKASPWRNGKGDVVKEFTDACREDGIKVGLYYSPADASCPVYKDERAYDDYFRKQSSELLDGRYGDIDMLWFDGCGSENHTYDWKRIICEIRKMQPGILVFNMGDPDYRWIGNEAGLAPQGTFNVVDDVDFSVQTDKKEALSSGKKWLPAECDFMIRDRNWFWSENDGHTLKTPEELLGIYYYSVGRGCNMLVNIGPDRRGLLPEKDVESLTAMGREVKRRFSNPLLQAGDFKRNGDGLWEWESSDYKHDANEVTGTVTFDHVVLQENIASGESARRFRISVMPYLSGRSPIVVYEGHNIGHKAICSFPTVRAKKVSIEIFDQDGVPDLKTINVFKS